MAFLLPGKRKARFSLSLQINALRRKPLICAPVHGRDDDFLRSHHDGNLFVRLKFKDALKKVRVSVQAMDGLPKSCA